MTYNVSSGTSNPLYDTSVAQPSKRRVPDIKMHSHTASQT